MSDLPPLARWSALIGAAGALAALLSLAGFPAAFLLGPMLAAIPFAAGGTQLSLPRPAFLVAQALIGCLVARAVTADFLDTLQHQGFLIVPIVLVTIAAGAVAGIALTRLQILPGATAAWGSAPGGAAAMVVLAEAHGSDPRLVAFMQYVRVAAVVFSASVVARLLVESGGTDVLLKSEPFEPLAILQTFAVAALGAGIAFAIRLPSAALIGPLLLGALLHGLGLVPMSLPGPILDLAYAGIGLYVGLRFNRETLATSWNALPSVLGAAFCVILLCAAAAWGLTRILPIDYLTAFLATSPGGLDSVAIIAVSSKADVSFVLSVQTLRLLVVLLTGPWLARWIARSAPE